MKKINQKNNQVRIIAGKWRQTPLTLLNVPNLRPTPNRIRETLFNWLGQDLSGQIVIDAFAGSGALGFEAASRGAYKVILIEQNPMQAKQLKALVNKLNAQDNVKIECTNAINIIENIPKNSINGIFLDPPFSSPELAFKIMEKAQQILLINSWIYFESPFEWGGKETPDNLKEIFEIKKQTKASSVYANLLVLK